MTNRIKRMGLPNVFRKYVLKQTGVHFAIIFFKNKWAFPLQQKVLLKTYFLFFLLLSSSLSAQRSAPVAGDAATLTDYLFKDYGTGNPETVMEDIAADRSRVIAIFKAYATKLTTDDKGSDNKSTSLSQLRLEYLQLQQDHNKQLAEKNPVYVVELAASKKTYYDSIAIREIKEITLLKDHFQKNGNLFLFSVVEKFETKYNRLNEQKIDVLAQNNSSQSMQKSVPFIGGDLLIDGIDGLSRFLAKRIKEELTLNAVENIQKYLKNEKQKNYLYELEAVLPVTVNYLKTFEADQILKFSDDLKQYIEQDLKNILKNVQNLRNTPRVMLAIQKNPDIDFAFEGLEVIDQISKMKSPVDYFSMLENSRNLQRLAKQGGERKKIANALALSTMLAYSLTVIKDDEVRFITTDFVASYGSREDFIKLYFGFLHQQNKKYFNNNPIDMSSFVQTETNFSEGQNYFRAQIIPIAENAERLYNQYLEIKRKNKNNEDVPYKEMHSLVNDVISFAEETVKSGDSFVILLKKYGDPQSSYLENLKNLFRTAYITNVVVTSVETDKFADAIFKTSIEAKNYSDKLKNYFSIAHLANNIMLDLDEKRYTNAITKAVEIPLLFQFGNNELNILTKNTLIQTQQFSGFNNLSAIININSKFSDDEKKTIWKNNKSKVEILSLQLDNKKSKDNRLEVLSGKIISFTDLSIEPWNQENYEKARDTLKVRLKQHQNDLISFMGFDVKGEKEQLKKILKDNITSENARSLIQRKYDEYLGVVFSQYVLNEEITDENVKNELFELYNAFLPELVTNLENKDKNNVIKLIHFVNDVAISDSPEAYEKAIESYVLPVGSSSLKEKTRSYYSINAYPGILGGLEKSNGRSAVGFVGLTAPVGLYIQPWSNINNKVTWGFFVPVIDIAAPVRLRLDKANDTQTLPDFEFADILAPGFYVSLGLKNSPFAFNLGLQYGPKLRDIPVGDSSSFTSLESYRIGLGLTIDIPLVTISSRYEND